MPAHALLHRERHVLAGGHARHERVAEGVRAVPGRLWLCIVVLVAKLSDFDEIECCMCVSTHHDPPWRRSEVSPTVCIVNTHTRPTRQPRTHARMYALVDRLDGVDDVALSLAHLLPLPVAHEPVHVDHLEGGLACAFLCVQCFDCVLFGAHERRAGATANNQGQRQTSGGMPSKSTAARRGQVKGDVTSDTHKATPKQASFYA